MERITHSALYASRGQVKPRMETRQQIPIPREPGEFRFGYQEFEGAPGLHLLRKILHTILPGAQYQFWWSVTEFQAKNQKAYVGVHTLSEYMGRCERTIRNTLNRFVERGLLLIEQDWILRAGQDGSYHAMRVRCKDFGPLYDMAYAYLYWTKSPDYVPPEREYAEFIQNHPHIRERVSGWARYQRLLKKAPGPQPRKPALGLPIRCRDIACPLCYQGEDSVHAELRLRAIDVLNARDIADYDKCQMRALWNKYLRDYPLYNRNLNVVKTYTSNSKLTETHEYSKTYDSNSNFENINFLANAIIREYQRLREKIAYSLSGNLSAAALAASSGVGFRIRSYQIYDNPEGSIHDFQTDEPASLQPRVPTSSDTQPLSNPNNGEAGPKQASKHKAGAPSKGVQQESKWTEERRQVSMWQDQHESWEVEEPEFERAGEEADTPDETTKRLFRPHTGELPPLEGAPTDDDQTNSDASAISASPDPTTQPSERALDPEREEVAPAPSQDSPNEQQPITEPMEASRQHACDGKLDENPFKALAAELFPDGERLYRPDLSGWQNAPRPEKTARNEQGTKPLEARPGGVDPRFLSGERQNLMPLRPLLQSDMDQRARSRKARTNSRESWKPAQLLPSSEERGKMIPREPLTHRLMLLGYQASERLYDTNPFSTQSMLANSMERLLICAREAGIEQRQDVIEQWLYNTVDHCIQMASHQKDLRARTDQGAVKPMPWFITALKNAILQASAALGRGELPPDVARVARDLPRAASGEALANPPAIKAHDETARADQPTAESPQAAQEQPDPVPNPSLPDKLADKEPAHEAKAQHIDNTMPMDHPSRISFPIPQRRKLSKRLVQAGVNENIDFMGSGCPDCGCVFLYHDPGDEPEAPHHCCHCRPSPAWSDEVQARVEDLLATPLDEIRTWLWQR
ncbi:hypothetical protein [Ktedonospora formicarum]|uniref:Uncharacterized protein n=1 Tax=Ktedonospora formicarum TaxID=2778364 RepID=A0A8J3I776_9CHLR|nr:hypothetical protein [Ktedonospora formicarum]GHO48120.1 hypothetical protein KSX_62830 [Ktedonospora formicarum]